MVKISTHFLDPLQGYQSHLFGPVPLDRDTQSYIENILQTLGNDSQARRNWRKLRKGMVVVQSMIRRAAPNEVASETFKNEGGGGSDDYVPDDVTRTAPSRDRTT